MKPNWALVFEPKTNEMAHVKVGDGVGFKSDYEQWGEVIAIERRSDGQIELTVYNKHGFGGDYLRYATTTKVLASDCWV